MKIGILSYTERGFRAGSVPAGVLSERHGVVQFVFCREEDTGDKKADSAMGLSAHGEMSLVSPMAESAAGDCGKDRDPSSGRFSVHGEMSLVSPMAESAVGDCGDACEPFFGSLSAHGEMYSPAEDPGNGRQRDFTVGLSAHGEMSLVSPTAKIPSDEGAVIRFRKTDEVMRAYFREFDAWIFICACGIAVRSIAPYIVSKDTDPAVVVMDEDERFVIPVLSGHLGGANALARRISGINGAQAAVTTATDVHGRFSPDCFAAANDLLISDLGAAKEIASAVLRGETIGVVSEYPVKNLPAQCRLISREESGPDEEKAPLPGYGIYIGDEPGPQPFAVTLTLVPKNIVLGIGFKRGAAAEQIAEQVNAAFAAAGLDTERICAVSSIDRKADEAGLKDYCRKIGVPSVTFSAQELAETGDGFTASAFVEKTVGIDNVCERSAVRAAGGRLILRKTAGGGVTAAAAVRPVEIDGAKEIRW